MIESIRHAIRQIRLRWHILISSHHHREESEVATEEEGPPVAVQLPVSSRTK